MTPHHLRKTALTAISIVFDVETAAAFADHKGIAVTSRHYIERVEKVGPDVRKALDSLAPGLVNDEYVMDRPENPLQLPFTSA